MPESIPDNPQPFPRELRLKAFLFEKAIHEGALPSHKLAAPLLTGPAQIRRNVRSLVTEESPVYRGVRNYIVQRSHPNPFDLQEHAQNTVSALLEDTEVTDVIDTLAALQASRTIIKRCIEGRTDGKRFSPRAHDMMNTFAGEIVQALPRQQNTRFVSAGHDLEMSYNRLFNRGQPFKDPLFAAGHAYYRMTDRHRLLSMALEGGFLPYKTGVDQYGEPLTAREARTLINLTAENIERLHLLKAYGLTTFEVKGRNLRLPWDVAVTPPISRKDEYDEHAIADFQFLRINDQRSSVDINYRPGEQRANDTRLVIGEGEDPVVRFRLYDNGQIATGSNARNPPGDLAERQFVDMNAWPAYVRLRALVVALAFDAQVPGEVVAGRDVGGGVGRVMNERPGDPVTARFTDLLLRRQQALYRSGVSDRQRVAHGWPKPEHPVRGHFVALPSGAIARSTAEEEAREYYERLKLPFPGLPENHTWRGAHTQGTAPGHTPYHRARFRDSSLTAEFLRRFAS